LRRRLFALLGGVAVAAAAVAAILLSAGGGSSAAAPFTLPRLGGGDPVHVPLRHDGTVQPTVLTFFASWCGPCHADVPVIAHVAATLPASERDVAFVGIDGNDDPTAGLAFARQSGVTFPVGRDFSSSVAPRYGLPGYPATVFIDRSGDVVHVVRGPITAAELHTWVAKVAAA
jgi:cytochrome c biogenesis protein CcmG/thiol:disulfide interchange protein DsbE